MTMSRRMNIISTIFIVLLGLALCARAEVFRGVAVGSLPVTLSATNTLDSLSTVRFLLQVEEFIINDGVFDATITVEATGIHSRMDPKHNMKWTIGPFNASSPISLMERFYSFDPCFTNARSGPGTTRSFAISSTGFESLNITFGIEFQTLYIPILQPTRINLTCFEGLLLCDHWFTFTIPPDAFPVSVIAQMSGSARLDRGVFGFTEQGANCPNGGGFLHTIYFDGNPLGGKNYTVLSAGNGPMYPDVRGNWTAVLRLSSHAFSEKADYFDITLLDPEPSSSGPPPVVVEQPPEQSPKQAALGPQQPPNQLPIPIWAIVLIGLGSLLIVIVMAFVIRRFCIKAGEYDRIQ